MLDLPNAWCHLSPILAPCAQRNFYSEDNNGAVFDRKTFTDDDIANVHMSNQGCQIDECKWQVCIYMCTCGKHDANTEGVLKQRCAIYKMHKQQTRIRFLGLFWDLNLSNLPIHNMTTLVLIQILRRKPSVKNILIFFSNTIDQVKLNSSSLSDRFFSVFYFTGI
jgi:hypothetical protein